MNKSDLIAVVAQGSGVTKAQASDMVGATLQAITDAMAHGEDVSLHGFGTFTTSTQAARTGRNPRTGDEIKLPEVTLAKFRPAKALKDAVKAKPAS